MVVCDLMRIEGFEASLSSIRIIHVIAICSDGTEATRSEEFCSMIHV